MLPHWRMICTAFLVAFGSSFQNGYFMLVYNVPQDILEDFVNESTHTVWNEGLDEPHLKTIWSTVASSNQIGRFIACVLAPMFADTLGRRATLLTWSVPAVLGIFLQYLAYPTGRFSLLAAGRLISGIYNGMVGILVPLFLVEIAITSKWRGAVTRIHNVVSVLGSITALTFGLPELLGTKDKWFYLPLLPLPFLFVEVFWLFRVPDSPLHLIERRHSAASIQRSMDFYFGKTEDTSEVAGGDQQDHKSSTITSGSADRSKLITTADGRQLLYLWLTLSLLASFAGAALTNNYSTAIMGGFKVVNTLTKYSSLIINIVKLIMVLLALYVIDRIGRRALLLLSAWLVLFCYVILICLGFFGDQTRNVVITYMKIFFVLVWTSTQYVVNSTAVLIVSESCRQNSRAFSLAVFKLVFHISSVMLTIVFPPAAHVSESFAYAVVGVPFFVLCLYLTVKCPETGYKNLLYEDIDDNGETAKSEAEKTHTEQTPLMYSEIAPSTYGKLSDIYEDKSVLGR